MDESWREASAPMRQPSTARHVLIAALAISLLSVAAGELRSLAWAPEVTDRGTSAGPQGESTLGDLVWLDANQNGYPGPSEAGIDGVLIRLYLDDGDGIFFKPGGNDALVGAILTGDDSSTPEIESGWYDFPIDITNALYWVEIAASNFDPGGPLEGATLTSGSTIGPTPLIVYLPSGVQDYNDADFGFYGATTSTRTPTPTPTQSPTGTQTATGTVTSTATNTATASVTPTTTATATETGTPTATGTATETGTPTETATPTATATPTWTRTPTSTRVGTAKPTLTASLTRTATLSPTASSTSFLKPTYTPTTTRTPTVSPTPSVTATATRVRGYIVYLPMLIRPFEPPPTLTRTPTPTATASRTPAPVPTGLAHPKAVAVDPHSPWVYVTSRDNNRLFMLDGVTLAEIGHADVGSQPWGVAVNGETNKVYVANFASSDVYVLDATTLDVLRIIPVGPQPTFVEINRLTNRVFVVSYSDNSVTVIDGDTDEIEVRVSSGGLAAWGLAINPNLNRVYVSNRDSGNITTLDGDAGYQVLVPQTIAPCGGAGSAPYEMDFNPQNDKLYVACSPYGSVDSAAIYQANSWGLDSRTFLSIDDGGGDSGGGVVVDGATGNVFLTNSQANTVSLISGTTDNVVATIAVGSDPFGIGADPISGVVYVANRQSDDLTVITDSQALARLRHQPPTAIGYEEQE
jgi:YVTN family beta-propeller protein